VRNGSLIGCALFSVVSETTLPGSWSRLGTSPTPNVRELPPLEPSDWSSSASRGAPSQVPYRVATPVTHRSVLSSHPTNLPFVPVLEFWHRVFPSSPLVPDFGERLCEPVPSAVSLCTFFLSLLGSCFYLLDYFCESCNNIHSFKPNTLIYSSRRDQELLASRSLDSFDVHSRVRYWPGSRFPIRQTLMQQTIVSWSC